MKAAGRALIKMTRAEVMRRKSTRPLRVARLAVCDGCEKMRRVRGRRVCGELLVETEDTCGCLLEAKAALTDEQCPWRTPEHPMGKWAELTVDTTDP